MSPAAPVRDLALGVGGVEDHQIGVAREPQQARINRAGQQLGVGQVGEDLPAKLDPIPGRAVGMV